GAHGQVALGRVGNAILAPAPTAHKLGERYVFVSRDEGESPKSKAKVQGAAFNFGLSTLDFSMKSCARCADLTAGVLGKFAAIDFFCLAGGFPACMFQRKMKSAPFGVRPKEHEKMRRFGWIGLLLLAGCQNIVGPFQPRV